MALVDRKRQIFKPCLRAARLHLLRMRQSAESGHLVVVKSSMEVHGCMEPKNWDVLRAFARCVVSDDETYRAAALQAQLLAFPLASLRPFLLVLQLPPPEGEPRSPHGQRCQ